MTATEPSPTPTPATAADVREALHVRWPAGEYVVIEEAPDHPSRQGTKLDMVAIAVWRSRGYELDGVEIKVSMSDWRRELRQPDKADWWWRHVHRFWIAAPSKIASKIRHELPGDWGLLSVADGGGVTATVQAERHQPEPLKWPHVIGLLRATEGAGWAALERARRSGFDSGLEQGRAQGQRESGGWDRTQYNVLLDQVKAFEEASGIELLRGVYSAEQAAALGRLVRVVDNHRHSPDITARSLRRVAEQLAETSKAIVSAADAYAAEMGAA